MEEAFTFSVVIESWRSHVQIIIGKVNENDNVWKLIFPHECNVNIKLQLALGYLSLA